MSIIVNTHFNITADFFSQLNNVYFVLMFYLNIIYLIVHIVCYMLIKCINIRLFVCCCKLNINYIIWFSFLNKPCVCILELHVFIRTYLRLLVRYMYE